MAGPLTGSLGWSGLYPVQLGGPPLVNTFSRPLSAKALPLLAHAYANDGVTANTTTATFAVLKRPPLKAKTTNGGYDQISLETASPVAGLSQGNVIRLSEIGGPFNGFVYGGVIESFPDTLSPTGPKHEIVVSPFGWELTRVATQLLYVNPIDIAQMVRDAVALTQHCSCDQVSVPPTTGIMASTTAGGQVDFRGQKVAQVLDTARSIAGPTWYWYCDELGRVWFQPQGSGPVYTLMGGQHYEERVSNGGDIQDRINQVPAVGGVPTGGSANVQATYNGTSQSTIGIRTLDPPIQLPGVTDQATVQSIANGIGATLDQTWTRVTLKALPTFGQRIHQSQPGGAMIRYWEPARNPMVESESGSGYVGPFICQSLEYDGLNQRIEAGSIPVTSQTDIDNMVKSWAQRAAAISLINTAAALNLKQTLTGTFQSGTGTPASTGALGTLWSLNQSEFAAIDPNAITRAEMGNLAANGVSPAQWGFRANDANGTPIFDSLGLIAVMKQLGQSQVSGPIAITSTTDTLIAGSAVTFSLARAQRVLFSITVPASVSGGNSGSIDVFVDGVVSGWSQWVQFTGTGVSSGSITGSDSLAAGSHTYDLRGHVIAGSTMTVQGTVMTIWLLGS